MGKFGFSRADRHSLAWRASLFIDPGVQPTPDPRALPLVTALLRSVWRPENAGLSVRAMEQPPTATGGLYIGPWVEVSSSQVFLEPPVVAAALRPRTALLTNRQSFATDRPNNLASAHFV